MDTGHLIAIVGQTASGKSSLALDIAERWNGEIVCADSRTLYKGMDIGTAKPSPVERAKVPHHLLDVAEPGAVYTAADFQSSARQVIDGIHGRGRLPVVVGGTGLYVDALLYDFDFRQPADAEQRVELNRLSVAQLQQKIIERGLPMPTNEQNPRHLIRTLETNGQIGKRAKLRSNILLVGLLVPRDELRQRIAARVDDMFSNGLEVEATRILHKYGQDSEATKAIGYREFVPYIHGVQTLDNVRNQIVADTWAYAKRQQTWFKRNPDILWCETPEQARAAINTFMTKTVQ